MSIKNENYITILGFMVNELNLKGNELMIYAIIYGFSQGTNQKFTGSRQYLCDWTNSSKQTVQSCLNSLVNKGLIIKNTYKINNVTLCEYHSTDLNLFFKFSNDTNVCSNIQTGGKEILPGVVKFFYPIILVIILVIILSHTRESQFLIGSIKKLLPKMQPMKKLKPLMIN